MRFSEEWWISFFWTIASTWMSLGRECSMWIIEKHKQESILLE